ncbi:MAG: hypothetical protein M1436_10430 [Acidobacteria bacterium]|nr:hypothetical protein [Acidobacteriota bacterium]
MAGVAAFINAARNLVNPLTAEGYETRPLNCHEAVLGWLLISMDYPRRWRLLRLAAARLFAVALTPQFQGDWMWRNIYQSRSPVNMFSIQNVQAGDILCSGNFGYPTHSMAVVSAAQSAALHRQVVKIRGFNNIGTFGQLLPNVPPVANPPQYDNNDRDVADPAVWNVIKNAGFGQNGVSLFRIPYAAAQASIARAFPWENSILPVTGGERWHYNGMTGWRWY